MPDKNTLLRQLPSVTVLLETDELRAASAEFGAGIVTSAVRQTVGKMREQILSSREEVTVPSIASLAADIAARLRLQDRTALRPVINATGILLHTGLGRAPLADAAATAAIEAARSYCNVELDLASGERSQRSDTVADLLCQLTGAEAAHVVNNNAGATALVLAALAAQREVVISHGELIEIGGGFRLPDVIETFGARLRPIGTTNKTRLSDYENAISEQTGALLVVHPSNYHIAGFTDTPPLADVARLAKQHGVPLVHDIGSGAMIDFSQFGCPEEPVAQASIDAGADLVLFSGDKLLGGPQAGIIVGGRHWMDKIAKHPLNRALRVDKVTLAALRATLQLYRRPEEALAAVPLLKFLSTSSEEVKSRATRIAEQLRERLTNCDVDVAEDEAFAGGGTTPQQAIASWCVTVRPSESEVNEVARKLRLGEPAVVGRVQHEQLIFGLHSVFAQQDQQLVEAIVCAVCDE